MTLLLLALLLVLPGAVALSLHTVRHRSVHTPAFQIGAPVVYQQNEVSACPAEHACDVRPAERGEFYYYCILKYLRVIEVMGDGRIVAVAQNHERLCFWPTDSCLRKAV